MLLFLGANSVKAQMDERFNDGKIPYGWYADGWTVKDNAAQKGSDSGGFDMKQMMGGDDAGFTYLMTPPLKVASGENLVFSAKKGDGGGMDSFMDSKDSTFVVERSVYGQHKWIQVADFTTEVTSDYKTFTISGTEAGEYRFRFRSASTVMIDSVAGFTIDMEAPDILVIDTVGDAKGAVKMIDFSLCKADANKQVLVVNTGTGKLTVNNSMSDANKFSFSKSSMEIAAGDSLDVNIQFSFAAGQPGKNESLATLKPADTRVENYEFMTYAIITEPNVWVENFNADEAPKSWIIDGWNVGMGVATVAEPSGTGMFGGSSFYLTTPPVTVESNTQALLFSVKDGDAGGGMGGMMGGGSSSPTITMEKSVYGSDKWEQVKIISGIDSVYSVQWISGIEPGDYRFRFVSADSVVIDSVAGFKIKENAPDVHVYQDGKATNYVFYGLCKENVKKTFKVYNSGTGPVVVNVSSTDDKVFNVKNGTIDVPASDSLFVDVEFIRDAAAYGENNAILIFAPGSEVLQAKPVAVKAYKISDEAWSEDFETPYVVEDESVPRELPEGWESTGWKVTKPSGGMMEMFGGGGEPKSWMATTESREYELITPRLQAVQGDVLKFDVDIDMMGSMMGAFGGDSDPAVLFVYYRRDVDQEWTLYNYYAQSGTVYFKAPYTGVYRLKFQGTGSLDNFLGLKFPDEPVKIFDNTDNQDVLDEYNNKVVSIDFDRELSAEQQQNGSWLSTAYTVCLPYDFNFSAYYPKEQVDVYKLDFVDNFYNEFVFSKTDGNVAAGQACLVVVNHGSISLDAIQTLVTNQPKSSDVYAYGNEAEPTVVGTWQGLFTNTPAEDEKLTNAFVMDNDGHWKPMPTGMYLLSFRAFMKMNEATEKTDFRPMVRENVNGANAPRRAQNVDANEHDGLVKFPADLYAGDLMEGHAMTGIATIRTIEADGSSRYYDLQGRQLNGKPDKGVYILNGKKYSK